MSAILKDEPIQIETHDMCDKPNHPECLDSIELVNAINSAIIGKSRAKVAFSLCECIVKIFLQDAFEKSKNGTIIDRDVKQGISHYMQSAYSFVQDHTLDQVDQDGIPVAPKETYKC